VSRAGGRVRRREALPEAIGAWWAPVAFALVVWGAMSFTFAEWRASAAWSGAVIKAGDLQVAAAALSWDCPDQGASGDASSLPGLVLSPGETVVLRQSVTPVAIGDNLGVALRVGFASLPADAVVTWHVEVDDLQVAPASGEAALGDTVVAPIAAAWDVVVNLTLPAGAPAWVDPTSGPSPEPPLALGVMTVTAVQVRCGDGFSSPCPTPGGD